MNCIIYSRVSTLEQDNERQIAELLEYAKYMKYDVLEVFQEKITGTSKAADRNEFKRLLQFIETKTVDNILVWEISRLGRSMLDVLNLVETLTQKKVNIFAKKESLNTLENGEKSLYGQMVISLLSSFAEAERNSIRKRSISGIRRNVQTGGSGTGIIKPYGYDKIEKKLIVNTEEAKIVKLIFSKYVSGLTPAQIANYLNVKKIPTRYNKLFTGKKIKQKYGVLKAGEDYQWKDGTIYSILKNSIYIGQRKHKGEIFAIQPIVDEHIFHQAQAVIAKKEKLNQSKRVYENPLKDLLVCGKCGRGYFMHKRADNSDNAYKCISKRYKEKCDNPSIGINKLLSALYIMCDTLMTHPTIEEKLHSGNAMLQAVENQQIELENIKDQINKYEKFLTSLTQKFVEGKISDRERATLKTEYTDKIQELTKRYESSNKVYQKLEATFEHSQQKNQYSKKFFKQYLKASVKTIKIFAVPDMAKFRKIFPSPQDVAVLVAIEPIIDLGLNPGLFHCLISQRSDAMALINFKKRIDINKQIQDQSYNIQLISTIESLKVGIEEYVLLSEFFD